MILLQGLNKYLYTRYETSNVTYTFDIQHTSWGGN